MASDPNYDASSLYIDPQSIVTSARLLTTYAQDVADAITRINTTLGDLALGWAGETQQEVDLMNQRWTTVMRGLFGTEDSPESGVLNVMAAGAEAVAAGNAQTEVALRDMFKQFGSAIDAPQGSGTPGSAPADRTDLDYTAITADW
ncbi:hypothetical protein [Streptomyces liangshanensis]|uniref:WXG100 family type VII secretion target n=1 Tax=Streptomyces liangshanensis TaxID=2717324 RepID=A0A6G9GZ68_9ACTN|nr:hypothetical protein [Streptomyces liangshanensis]QIQ03514.1 hypothetical protein HA039_15295 [Streptomyces liangshanensis]